MMVTFVAQCEKKSLNKTRRVLDAFANRIGDRTWQTVITNDGLQAVKKLLRKTASKNTAVACHWIRSRSRSELIWIVGNRERFNSQGIVPVNTTRKTIMNTQWENDWHYLPLIKSLAAMAALFHDWGKASEFFQSKLKTSKIIADPLRHEWISALFLNAYVNGETDEQWLSRLAKGEIETETLKKQVSVQHQKQQDKNKPLNKLPQMATLLNWLLLSHHRLPILKSHAGTPLPEPELLFQNITQKWGYENKFDKNTFKHDLKRCFDYPQGLPCDSEIWLKAARKQAQKLHDCLPLLSQSINDGTWRLLLHHTRLALMLGDHCYSSQEADNKWQTTLDLYANSDRKTKKLKQKLDEHLIGVSRQALRNAHLLPAFEGEHKELQRAYDVKALKRKSQGRFCWQDTAVSKIKHWKSSQDKLETSSHFGFFAVNMASTGTGKTFANAKIMRTLSADGESLRYILALGLRTLTLQTGDEYRQRIKLGNDELAVLIGSRAVMDLHNKNKQEQTEEAQTATGSESEEYLLDNEIDFHTEIPETELKTVLTREKDRKFLFAPVLSCTIDHLMAATESKRGGRYILPTLRLMSSDLVIDEIDDFDGNDLIAIGRLIHLAGMLGRKVMISSATIPPDIAEGYYNTYQAGWALFAQMRQRNASVGCAWMDEFTTQVHSIQITGDDHGLNDYQKHHQKFIDKRTSELEKQTPKRKADIIACSMDNEDEESIRKQFYATIQTAILEKHQQHYQTDEQSGKCVSFGLVRIANINPCVALTRYLLNAQWPQDVEIRAMAYHSQQILIMRNAQEKHLDAVLKRQQGSQAAFEQKHIRQHLQSITAPQVIFILVATPVEEVGRDHDFDWAVVEPSSYRSFVQLAGRVLRHREPEPPIQTANIALLQYNLKGLLNTGKPVFCHPGYESNNNPLDTHDLKQLINAGAISQCLDAKPRINKASTLNPRHNLADLEHVAIHQCLTNYEQQGPESMQGWLTGYWWLTAIPQYYVQFRKSEPQQLMYLVPADDDWKFAEKDTFGKSLIKECSYNIKHEELNTQESQRLWLTRDYETLLRNYSGIREAEAEDALKQVALIYGEISLPTYGNDPGDMAFSYSSQLGLIRV
ncbi:type I-F CRISPR-associated helicase Cas3f [Candidatus Venteria ishoeyi]|uniref:type I-F CRISPR-associated helicase Cas3f n=1 Tax=Candidatus Venteria ishoeyi TaxID=1899563 RepID=UPI0025A6803E|nr:type I-F CRISPR-associated helicase Cas3f [Candidatus Venteria ishoeyi]MDM8547643.1 type I-F CRISPR-associated helicase Cas3f [Candidatus Venteria ishoeyi]